MGAFDWLSQAQEWAKNRYWDQGVKKTFTESWGSFVGREVDGEYKPGVFEQVAEGGWGITSAPFSDDGDFWGSTRMWLDGMVAGGSAVLGGTIGTLFQIPVLHEAAWLLDKAYRYIVARPISTAFMLVAGSQLEAYEQGRNSDMDLLSQMSSWNSLKQAWNDSAYVTPGQAIAYSSGGLFQDMGDDLHEYLKEYDPRTPGGQAIYNSPDADFWMKYTSGSIDFAANIFADPGHGAAAASKAAKLRFIDKVATEKYVAAKGVHGEVGTSTYRKVFDLAAGNEVKHGPFKVQAKTPEELRNLAFPNHRFGGQVSTLLWTAARLGEDIYRDTYLSVRAFDPEAYARLTKSAPKIAADYADMYANYSIADGDFQRGMLESGSTGPSPLRKTPTDAFVDSWAAGEGIWGTALAKGAGEKIPKVRTSSILREGYHSKVLNSKPIVVAKPLVKAAAALMPSQGWTPRIDPMDGTGVGLRQFRANLERTSHLSADEVNQWVSQYGAATSDASRHTAAIRVEELVISRMLEQHGISKFQMPAVLRELNKWRAGSRRLWGNERRYISEEAAKAAERATTYGPVNDAVDILKMTPFLEKQIAEGTLAGSFVSLQDAFGRVNIIPIMDDAGEAGARGIARNEPILRSQFADAITMLDYRAFNAGLRWWNITHPKPKKTKAEVEAILREQKDKLSPEDIARLHESTGIPKWRIAFAEAARVRGVWDASIGAADSLMMSWKASALFRPAQAARNVADDILRMYGQFGKLPLLMSMANSVPNMWKNWTGKGLGGKAGKAQLISEVIAEKLSFQHQTGRERPRVEASAVVDAPGNVDLSDVAGSGYLTVAGLFTDGKISFQQYLNWITAQMDAVAPVATKSPAQRIDVEAMERRRANRSETFTPSASRAAAGLGGPAAGKTKAEKPIYREPRRSQQEAYTASPYGPFGISGPSFILERALIRDFDAGTISAETLKIRLIENALAMTSKPSQFRKRPWQYKVLRTLVDRHINRRSSAAYKENPYLPATVIVDPFGGTFPEELVKNAKDNFDITQETVLPVGNVEGAKTVQASVDLTLTAEGMRQWVDLYADELLSPGTLMALRVKPDGNVAIGLARAKKQVLESGETIKVSARQQFADFQYKDIKDMAHTGVDLTDRSGNVIGTIPGVMEGPLGQQLQHRISARVNPSQAYGAIIDPDLDDLVGEQGSWTQPMRPDHIDYPSNWERAVNAQISNDPVARLFLEGKSNKQVLDELETTAWGSKWIRSMGFRGIAYADQVDQIRAMVDTYIPNPVEDLRNGVDFTAAAALREAALRHEARFDGLEKSMKNRDEMPEIHGLSVQDILGTSLLFKKVRTFVGRMQKIISDLPVDKLARFPFMAMEYQRHGTMLARIANEVYDGPVPAGVMNHIQEIARERAYHDTRYRLYDTAQRNDFAMATRLMMPFSGAMMDSYIKYGRAIRENPMILVQGAYYWNVFERSQMVQDENGYVAEEEGGQTVWYQVDPETGDRKRVDEKDVGTERYVQFQLPSFMADVLGMDTQEVFGVEGRPVIAVNKKTMNVFLNLPGTGPLVALPANEFALDKPEFSDHYIIKEFVLPFGPSSNRLKTVLPSTVQTAWDAFVSQDGDMSQGHAAAIMQAELTGYALGTRSTPPTFEEVRAKAAGMRGLRFMATFVSPASFQMVSPYQTYIDAYRQLIQEDPQHAAERFQQRYGDEFYALTMSVSRNNAGITASIKSHNNYLKYKELVEMYPEFGGLIVGAEGAGEFNKAVYESQKVTPVRPGSKETMRSLMDIGESVRNLQSKQVWMQYSKLMDRIQADMVDRGITSLRSRAARDLAARKANFVNANKMWIDPANGEETMSPWYRDYLSSDPGKIELKFEALRKIVADPELIQRDDVRGLAKYLAMRNTMQDLMRRYGFKSLSGQKAGFLATRWDSQVHDLTESNLPFKSLWNRWLSNDNDLNVGGVNG